MQNYSKKHYKKKTFIPIDYLPKLKGEKLLPGSVKPKVTDDIGIDQKLAFDVQDLQKKFICISVKEDCSQNKAMQQHLDVAEICFLAYDFIGEQWDFYYCNGDLVFIVNSEYILPLGIYNRPFVPPIYDERHGYCLSFNLAIQIWDGYKINCGMENYANSSKPLQIHLINHIIQKNTMDLIAIPNTFIIKLKSNKAKKFLSDQQFIVKSCSGVRSKVELYDKFCNGDFKSCNNIPTLFQACIVGNDIRIHAIKLTTYAVQVKSKSGIDYRYNKNSGYELVELPVQVKDFCLRLKDFEKLSLVGVDLIFVPNLNIYYVLEANPNPGWAGFHRNTNEEASLAGDLINVES